MDQDRDPGRRDDQDNRGSSNSNLIWYVLAIGFLVLLALVFVFSSSSEHIVYGDLEDLIQDGQVEVKRSSDGRVFRYHTTARTSVRAVVLLASARRAGSTWHS